MTHVDFYFNAASKADVARKLAAKAFQAGQQALLYTTDEALAREIDTALWTHSPLSFLPHARCGHALAAQTPILIGSDADALGSADVLINLSGERPPFFSRFARLIELVARDPADREAARERFRFYRERGYAIATTDLEGV